MDGRPLYTHIEEAFFARKGKEKATCLESF